jgi:crotonobetainyl-CoA:carnitine CoA-transferase CaiB-like acyl-CoA transferase
MRTADDRWDVEHPPLGGVRVLTLAVNLPGPVAAARLREMGATVVKIEPPGGDPLARMCPGYYTELGAGQEVVSLNLKDEEDRASLDDCLENADLLLTASRPAALGRLGLSWPEVHARFPGLCQVAIVGHPPPDEDAPGHDLTYQARFGTLSPPGMRPVLVADLAGAERVVSAALSLLFARERGRGAGHEQVALSDAVRSFAGPLRWGLTAPGGVLGGGLAGYGLYRAREGHVAVAALEKHFWERLREELGIEGDERRDLERVFATRTAGQWEKWAAERELPLVAVQDVERDETASTPEQETSTRGEAGA